MQELDAMWPVREDVPTFDGFFRCGRRLTPSATSIDVQKLIATNHCHTQVVPDAVLDLRGVGCKLAARLPRLVD